MDASTEKVLIAAIGAVSALVTTAFVPMIKRWIESNTALGRERLRAERENSRDNFEAEKDEKNWLRDHVAALGLKIGELEGRVKSLETERVSLLEKLAARDVVIAKLEAELARKQEHIDTFEEENRALEAEITRMRHERGCETCQYKPRAATA